jgi:hypothetical protein
MNQQGSTAQQYFARALLDPQFDVPRDVVAWNGSDPTRRFAVYRNNVIVSLVNALADTFPVVQELVGTEFFRAAAAVFVRQAPPESPILAFYGSRFPAFIESFGPVRSVPYLADVARLEFARVLAYHASDARPLSVLDPALLVEGDEALGELRFDFHPCASIVHSQFAVVSLWAAHNGAQAVEDVDIDSPEAGLVTRVNLDVEVVLLRPGDARFISALADGADLATSVERAMHARGDFDLASALSTLLRQQALTSVRLPRRQPT